MGFLESIYTLRVTDVTFKAQYQASTPEETSLATIEATLVEANKLYLARRYQAAIAAYLRARDLIYSQLHTSHRPGSGLTAGIDKALFDGLLSASAEWLNVLPVPQPPVAIRPRIGVDDAALNKPTLRSGTGLQSQALAKPRSVATAADIRLADTLTRQGNDQTASFFMNRARQSDEHTTAVMLQSPPQTTEAELIGDRLGFALQPLTQQSIATPQPFPATLRNDRQFSIMRDNELVSMRWSAGAGPPLAEIKSAVYVSRVNAKLLTDVVAKALEPSELAVLLPHHLYYTIPLALAECYHAMGDYPNAQTYYLAAASYEFLNAAIEAPYVWLRLATLYLDWGSAQFRDDDTAAARVTYENVLLIDGTEPASQLYTIAGLKPGADAARIVITNLATLLGDGDAIAGLGVNPDIGAVVLDVHQQLLKIRGGLDYWGHRHNAVPIWTFEFLQNAAINFTQLAISAERDTIDFQQRADDASLTRQQMVQTALQANAEVSAAELNEAASRSEELAFTEAEALARKRADDAGADADEYATKSAQSIVHQAVSQQISGGDNGNANDLNFQADLWLYGKFGDKQLAPGTRVSGSRATFAASEQLAASRLTREYEVDRLNRQSEEMQAAATQAKAETAAAQARTAAAQAGTAVAKARKRAAQQNLAAFDNQFFTPDVWYRMADTMRRLYDRYLQMAIRVARHMQQAYNFETDQQLDLIKTDYSSAGVKGLLGADMLMADIQTFSYELITSRAGKQQPMRQTISLAERYAFAFENQLRKTGVMDFETSVDDFDEYYPGTYAGRIQVVEVEVDGIVPPSGISGSLTNGGVSCYRMPAAAGGGATGSGLKYRVQSAETLVLSDYSARGDALLQPPDRRQLRVFEGAGLASTWRLELPKAVNDIDYGALTDVRITLHYKARFDPDLHDRVIAELATRPGVSARQRAIPLRWLYPDAFFAFQDTGVLSLTLSAVDFRRNEQAPKLTDVGIVMALDPGEAPSGIKISLATPGQAAVSATTSAEGTIESATAGSPWAPLAGGSALGPYTLTLTAADNPRFVKDGKLQLAPIANIALVLGYSFTRRT
jgi:hypothetical protein